MKKSVFFRMMTQIGLYCVVFLALVSLQFSAKGDFSLRINGMNVSGRYRPDSSADSGEGEDGGRLLSGGVKLFFGGIEFSLKENGGFALLDAADESLPLNPERIIQYDDELCFALPGGTELVFTAPRSDDRTELRIDARFAGDSSALVIPFRLYRSQAKRDQFDDFLVRYSGDDYQFTRSTLELEQGLLVLRPENSAVAYRAVPKQKAFNLSDYVVTQGRNLQSFNEALSRWRDASIPLWQQSLGTAIHEDTVIALGGEGIRRGNYRSFAGTVPRGFISGNQSSFESSLFLGGMDRALRSLGAAEREKAGRISRALGGKSLDFLRESHVLEYAQVRGQENILESMLEIIRSLDPALLDLELCPGVLEGYLDFRQLRLSAPNPFEGLIDRVCKLTAEGLVRDSEHDRVFVSHNGTADMELNFQMGKALWTWAESSGDTGWAAVGRSLMLSVLSLQDQAGTIPAAIAVSGGVFGEASGKVQSARFYRILKPGDYYPRTVRLGAAEGNTWAWTVSPSVSAVRENNLLDISVSFPVNETHYMLIRGVRPFSRIQLYNTNWPTDPYFERYDSSGWVYSAQEQTLVLKMKHRETVEHIRIYSGEAPPAPPPVPEEISPEEAQQTASQQTAPQQAAEQTEGQETQF
jgi:hypothetical protein